MTCHMKKGGNFPNSEINDEVLRMRDVGRGQILGVFNFHIKKFRCFPLSIGNNGRLLISVTSQKIQCGGNGDNGLKLRSN